MKQFTLLILLLMPLSINFGQEIFLGFQSGLGWYKMEELKYFNSGIAKASPIEPQLIVEYPPFIYYRPYITVKWERAEVGISYSFHSTGSRYSRKDYSGEYLFDTRISCEGPALLGNYRIYQLGSFRFMGYNEIGYLKTKMMLDESLYLDNDMIFDESYRFISSDCYWEPGLEIEYPFSLFLFEFNVGYMLQFKGKGLKYQGDYFEGFLQVSGENVHAGWNGLRLGLSASINLSRLKYGGGDQ